MTTCTATHGDDRCTLHATHRGSHYDSMTDYSWRDETMTTTTYRACYWLSDDRQHEVVLTTIDSAALDDYALLAAARAEADRAGMQLEGGSLVIGPWRD